MIFIVFSLKYAPLSYSIIRAKTFLSLGFQTVSIFQSSIVPFLLSKFMPTFTTGSLHKANRLE